MWDEIAVSRKSPYYLALQVRIYISNTILIYAMGISFCFFGMDLKIVIHER